MHFTIPVIGLFAALGSALPTPEPAPVNDVTAVNGTELVARELPKLHDGPVCFYADCLDFQGVFTYHSEEQCPGPWAWCFGCDKPGYYTYSCGGFQFIDDYGPVEAVPGSCSIAAVGCIPRD